MSTPLWHDETPWLFGLALLLVLLLFRFLPTSRATLRHSLLLLGLWLLLDALSALFASRAQASVAQGLHQVALFGLGVVLIRLAGLALFRVLLPALHAPTPRIVEDIVVIAGYVLWGMVQLSFAGVELSSLVATSAVITAVLAFAMQDTLGNILGGLALQLDNSLGIGDWVRLDDVSGRVVEIQWRYTAILTRNGEKVVVPNAQLMKGKFAVIGSHDLGVTGWRRWIGFSIGDHVGPSQVIEAVQKAIADAEIVNVAREPAPTCLAMDFGPGAIRYALRYWLVDPRDDDPTDSAVRIHLLAALQRQGWRIALADQVVHLVQETSAQREAAWHRELARRLAALSGVELFAALDEAERRKIAERLVPTPFARGDVMTRQGAAAHWLYIIVAGEAEVHWEDAAGSRHLLTRLPPGQVFGEMGLMTGAPRGATVTAATEVECYRLDKASFEDIIRDRPVLAEGMARILAQRVAQNEALQQALRAEQGERPVHHAALLDRIREFFGLQ